MRAYQVTIREINGNSSNAPLVASSAEEACELYADRHKVSTTDPDFYVFAKEIDDPTGEVLLRLLEMERRNREREVWGT